MTSPLTGPNQLHSSTGPHLRVSAFGRARLRRAWVVPILAGRSAGLPVGNKGLHLAIEDQLDWDRLFKFRLIITTLCKHFACI